MATILIVDPDPATRSLLEVLVLRLGHRPIGQWELAEDESPRSHAPILCVSIDPPGPEVRELGVAGHVMKPFRRSQLERALESALGVRPRSCLKSSGVTEV
ncbi:MAG TPA: hypothetical protein VF327_01255 [Gaiellaceae bacterium]